MAKRAKVVHLADLPHAIAKRMARDAEMTINDWVSQLIRDAVEDERKFNDLLRELAAEGQKNG